MDSIAVLHFLLVLLSIIVKLYLMCVCVCVEQVCKAVAAAAGAAFHRPQVSRTLVLFQAHRGHAHRHLPHGDAGGAPSNDVKISHPPVALGDWGKLAPPP